MIRIASILANHEQETAPVIVAENAPTPTQPPSLQPPPWSSYPSNIRDQLQILKDIATTLADLINKIGGVIKGLNVAE